MPVSAVTVLAVLAVAVALAWRFEDTLLGVLPPLLCAMGLVLYVLAFFNALSAIDWLWLAAGLWAVWLMGRMARAEGTAALRGRLRRILDDPNLWVCVVILAVMCLCLRGEQILEWDGYNFWGPDTKSLFYRDGYAPLHSNPASRFGDYTPMAQLIWWWFTHLAGAYGENYVFMGYYIFGALLLFGVADRFRGAGRPWNVVVAAVACVCAVVLPGVACTAWYRALCVDPLMAMVFGLTLSLTVCRSERHPGFWRAKLLALAMCLTLVKSIGILWAALALGFWCLWWGKERGAWRFALVWGGGIALCRASWSVFCGLTERSTALVGNFYATVGQRLRELADGVFLTSGNNRGYLVSYAKAFLCTPIHRESTPALDIPPVVLVLLLLAAALLLWRFGFVPRRKGGRLLAFMAVTLAIIYLVVVVGQLTMFYTETGYLEPVKALTLMTRYCAPAHMGLLMLLCTFASGQATGSAPEASLGRRRAVALGAAAAVILSCGAYSEMYRRFVQDDLDPQRIRLRESYCEQYSGFLSAVEGLPLDRLDTRVLLCIYQTNMNPIVINEASPISFCHLALAGDGEGDLAAILAELERTGSGYLYVDGCTGELAEALAAAAGEPVETGVLYRVTGTEPLRLTADS